MNYPASILFIYRALPRVIGLNYEKEFRQQGYRVTTCDISEEYRQPDILCQPDSDISEILACMQTAPDLIVYFESRQFFPKGWEKITVPRIWYSTEGDVNFGVHQQVIDLFDVLFSSNKVVADTCTQAGYVSYWLPLAVDPTVHYPVQAQEIYDVMFIGTLSMQQYQQRASLLRTLESYFNVKIITQATQAECREWYAQAKIIFDKSLGHGMNTRPFEALACRKLLLTAADPFSGLDQLLQNGEHLITYQDHELIQQIDAYLAAPDQRQIIANKGYQHILQAHTYAHRVQYMIEKIREHSSFGVCLNVRQKQIYSIPQELALRYSSLYINEQLRDEAAKCLAYLPETSEILAKKSILSLINSQLAESLRYFEQAIAAKPTQHIWHYQAAVVACLAEKYEYALAQLSVLNALEPQPIETYLDGFPPVSAHLTFSGPFALSGFAHLSLNHLEQAYTCLIQATDNPMTYHPHVHWHVLYLLSICHWRRQAFEQALHCAEQALQKNPISLQIYELLIELWMWAKQHTKVQQVLFEAQHIFGAAAEIERFSQALEPEHFGFKILKPV